MQERDISSCRTLPVFEVVIMSKFLSAQEEADEIIAEFSFFDDWADRYQHLIDQADACLRSDLNGKMKRIF